jgi:hypothetical protein
MVLKRFAFGATAAVMTSMALVIGLGSANTGKASIIAGLLIIGIADNLSDSLGIHIHEECDTKATEAFSLSASNYATRLVIVCSFIAIVAILPFGIAQAVTLAWGIVLLSVLTYFIAKARSASALYEIALHLFVAAVVVVLSQVIGTLIRRWA